MSDPYELLVTALNSLAWPVAVIVVSVLTYLLFRNRKVRSAKVDLKNKTLQVNGDSSAKTRNPDEGQCSETTPQDLAMDRLIEVKYRTIDDVRAAQKGAIEPHYRQFESIFSDELDGVVVDNFWRHFNDALVQAADDNHVLGKLQYDGSIDPGYVATKVDFVRDRHSILTARFDRNTNERRRASRLPDWDEIKSPLYVLMAACLGDFVAISKKHWEKYRRELNDNLETFPSLERRIRRLQEDI